MIRKQKLEELKSYIEELRTIEICEKQPIKVVDEKLEKGFLDIQKLTCLLGNGCVIKREQLLKNGRDGSAAVVLPITKDGQVILVVQPRIFNDNTVGIELPAGYIEEGEKPYLSAKRELEEETGYVPEEMYELGKYYQDQGCSKAFNYSYLAVDCEKKKEQCLDKDEVIRYFECTYEEVLELAELGYINDANSLLALEKSRQYVSSRGRIKRKGFNLL